MCGSREMLDPKNRQKSPSPHHRTTLSGYIFATKARIDNLKLDGCIVWHVLGEEAVLIYIVPVCYVKAGRYGTT